MAQITTSRILGSLRGYFLGVTIVAAFSAVVVAIGSIILGVPLVGTIAAVTFIGGYIPYLGAWSAAAFAVLIALGGAGPEAAAGMVVVQLLANGILQQMVQPFAMGSALGIHPLAVLIVTIAGGALFGAVGLILAAPLTSAVTRISADLARARAEREEGALETRCRTCSGVQPASESTALASATTGRVADHALADDPGVVVHPVAYLGRKALPRAPNANTISAGSAKKSTSGEERPQVVPKGSPPLARNPPTARR